MHFINHQALFAIAKLFGRPLQVDQATADKVRPNVARVLVELDITKKYPNAVWVGSENYGYSQKVEFEKFPVFCSFCKSHGHEHADCFLAHPWLRKKDSNASVLAKDQQNTEILSPKSPTLAGPNNENDSSMTHLKAGNLVINSTLVREKSDGDSIKNNGDGVLPIVVSPLLMTSVGTSLDERVSPFKSPNMVANNLVSHNIESEIDINLIQDFSTILSPAHTDLVLLNKWKRKVRVKLLI